MPVALSAFRTRIAPRVLTALDPAIDQAVLDTCIDFCEQSLVVTQVLDPMLTVAGVAEYELDTGSTTLGLVKVMRAWCQERTLSAAAEDDVPRASNYADFVPGVTPSRGFPIAFHELSPGVIRLMPMPDGQYPVTMRVALRPTRAATTVPDILFEYWVEPIVDGALVRLYSTPGVQYSNPQMVGPHAAAYRVGVNRALLEAGRGRTRAEFFVRPIHI